MFDLRLSDDGTLAAYVIMAGDLQYELWAINTDGSNDHKLVSSDELKAVVPEANSVALNQFEWVPGTHQVAYNTRVIVQAPGDFFNKDLYLVDADSLEKQVVFQPGSAGKFYFSPDGQQIALASPGLLSLVNADGSNLREALTFTVAGTTEEFPYYPIPVWAQDASRLAVAVPASDPRTTARQEATLWLIPLDGSAATKAGSFQTVFAPANRLFISPDLAHVLYTLDSSDPGSSQGEVHLARIDGSEDRIVAAQAYLMAYGWSSPETFLYGGGDPVDVVEGQVSGTTQVLAPGIGGLYDAHDAGNGDVLLMQGNGPIWTFSLAADGSIFPVDSGGGGTPAAFDIDW